MYQAYDKLHPKSQLILTILGSLFRSAAFLARSASQSTPSFKVLTYTDRTHFDKHADKTKSNIFDFISKNYLVVKSQYSLIVSLTQFQSRKSRPFNT